VRAADTLRGAAGRPVRKILEKGRAPVKELLLHLRKEQVRPDLDPPAAGTPPPPHTPHPTPHLILNLSLGCDLSL
jgi:hypothetical protein